MFNVRLNNRRKNTKKLDSILACKHFQQQGHNVHEHKKFNIIEKTGLIYVALKKSYESC